MNIRNKEVNLLAHFNEARLPISTIISRSTWRSNVPIVRLSVDERPIEHFMVDVGDEKNRVEVLNIDKSFRQLVLLVKEPKREYTVPRADRDGNIKQIKEYTDPTERRYLMGLDERHLFISGLPKEDINTVAEAHQALKHKAVIEAEKEGKDVKRQGEYFFIPLTKEEEKEFMVKVKQEKRLRKTLRGRLQRLGHRAHFIRRMIVMRRGTKRYAQGHVTHEQHEPMYLPSWHRVYKNRETSSPGINGFVD